MSRPTPPIHGYQILMDTFYFVKAKFVPLSHYVIMCVIFWAVLWLGRAAGLDQSPGPSALLSLVNFLIFFLLHCGLLVFIDALSKQQNITPYQALALALPRVLFYAVAIILSSSVVVVGLIFFIVPGIYLYTRLLLTDLLVVLEEKKTPFQALSTSMEQTKEHTAQLIAVVLICAIPVFLLIPTIVLLQPPMASPSYTQEDLLVPTIVLLQPPQEPSFFVEFLWIAVSWVITIFWALMRYRCYSLLRENNTSV